MERDDVITILEIIQKSYSRFQVDTRTVDVWEKLMVGMSNELVIKKLMKHILESKWPPTIAEISAYPPKEDKQLLKLEQMRIEHEKVPQHIKDEFREALNELVRKRLK